MSEAESLQALRERIDALDRQIQTLISERARCAQRIGALKQAAGATGNLYRPERETQVLRRVIEANQGPLSNEEIRALPVVDGSGVHEVVVVVVSFLIYFLIRGSVVDRAGEAMVRGFNLIELEQRMGIYWELEMQSWILDHYWLIKTMNAVYFWGKFPN